MINPRRPVIMTLTGLISEVQQMSTSPQIQPLESSPQELSLPQGMNSWILFPAEIQARIFCESGGSVVYSRASGRNNAYCGMLADCLHPLVAWH